MRKTAIWLAAMMVLPAAATTVAPMTVERLTQVSALVVEGQAGETWSAWDAGHTTILTYTRFQVARTLKGAAAGTIMIKQIGGHAGGYAVKVAGVRHLQPGEEHVLFLHPSLAGDGTFVIAGLMQGDFQVHRTATEATVTNGVPGVHSYERSTGTMQEFTGSRMSLGQLEDRVQKAVAR
jgi:hypothetical protein